jgi:hypothetical protein
VREKAGLVKLGHVAIDGTKIKANASKHEAMSYERMEETEQRLKAEIEALLKPAEDMWTRPRMHSWQGHLGIVAKTRNPPPASPSGKPQRVSIADSFEPAPCHRPWITPQGATPAERLPP